VNSPSLDPESIEALIAEFAGGDDLRAEAAAQRLAALGAAALPRLAPLAAARGSPGNDGRWWAARTLAMIDGPQAEALLMDLLDDPDPDLRACAAVGLGERRSLAATARLAGLLDDASPYLARLAGDALIRIGLAAAPDLIAALQDAASPQRRAGAARALAHLAAPEAIPALFQALEDESTLVRHWADEALDRLGLGMVYFY
jgi:HEAT repeat protein